MYQCAKLTCDILLLWRLNFKVIHVHRRSSFGQETSLNKVRHTDVWNIHWTTQWLQHFQGSQERYNFVKDFKPMGTFLGSKQDPKLSLVTTVDFVIVGLHHIYSIQNNKEDVNKISKLLNMSQLQTCDFSYNEPWIARNNNFSC